MINRIKTWIRDRLPTWAHLVLLSRTIWGSLLTLFGLLAEQVDGVRAFMTAYGMPNWVPIAAGIALVIFSRARDAYTGANRP